MTLGGTFRYTFLGEKRKLRSKLSSGLV